MAEKLFASMALDPPEREAEEEMLKCKFDSDSR